MKTNFKKKEIQLDKNKVVNHANKNPQQNSGKFTDKLPGWRSVLTAFVYIAAIYGAYSFIYDIYGYFHNVGMISVDQEKCANDPSAEKCKAPIVDALKAGKNAAGIVSGASKNSLKEN